MADEANKSNKPRPEEVPAPSQDGMINAKPGAVPKPPESEDPASEQTPDSTPTPPPSQQGHVDDEAAVDVKPAASLENPPPPPTEPTSPSKMDPTVAQLDKSHESDLDQAAQEPKTQEEPAHDDSTPKKPHSNVLLAAVVAVLVTMLLVGIGFAAWQASNSSEEAEQVNDDSAQTAEDEFDSEDASQLDQKLNQLENDLQQLETDLDETGVDDESLGL